MPNDAMIIIRRGQIAASGRRGVNDATVIKNKLAARTYGTACTRIGLLSKKVPLIAAEFGM